MENNLTLIFDGNNMCHVHFHGNKDADDDFFIPMTFKTVLSNMKYIFSKFKPNKVVIAFDEISWRKIYTKDLSKCVTHKKYKSGRRKNKTPKELKRLEKLEAEMECLKLMFDKHTSVLTLYKKYLEADDLIAGYVQQHPNENHIIVSSDKDFMQLLHPNVKLYNPVEDKFRTLDEWNNDPELFLFEKCIRGDSGDSVISSYPRLRKVKILEAYTDDLKRTNIMNHKFAVEDLNETTGILETHNYITHELFEENQLLMDLRKQPDNIKNLIVETINTAKQNNTKFSMFHFLKFCGKYELDIITKSVNQYIPMLNL